MNSSLNSRIATIKCYRIFEPKQDFGFLNKFYSDFSMDSGIDDPTRLHVEARAPLSMHTLKMSAKALPEQ
jgi:hypothetical protein